MEIHIRGAQEHNLKNLDIRFGDGLTVVTGVSGSGKTSLVFDTLYHEAQRRFLDIYLYGAGGQRLRPATVEAISGLRPAIAVGQNLLNRNPLSSVATASGVHPFLRLLFTNFGVRHCLNCGESITVCSEDEIIERLLPRPGMAALELFSPLLHAVAGSHRTLLELLTTQFGAEHILVDSHPWDGVALNPGQTHSIEVRLGTLNPGDPPGVARELISQSTLLGGGMLRVSADHFALSLATVLRCTNCAAELQELRAAYFNQNCPYCNGRGCERCAQTGMHPQAASTRWQGMLLPELLELSIEQARELFLDADLPSTATRLLSEIQRRLDALEHVGLGYLALNRPAPTLSRGESQRVRLAISLSSRLEDTLHVLDEPTIGQHPADIARFLPAFRELPGPVIYIEHDRIAAAEADHAVDLGPGAGIEGGQIVFNGTPAGLWQADTATGRYFSQRQRVLTPEKRPPAKDFIEIHQARLNNLNAIDVQIPLRRLTVITGVSGSGKSSLVEQVLAPSLEGRKPVGCQRIDAPAITAVMVDQSPIGRNPRSNPATYTQLADPIRDLFAQASGLSKSHFSFNRPEGACPTCQGLGATEIKMRYLPSVWVTCASCSGLRFSEEVLAARVDFGGESLSIGEFFALPVASVGNTLLRTELLSPARRVSAGRILQALVDLGLGYLELGQPSPTLSGGEAQRVKLTKYLGRDHLSDQLLILDEPSTGLHPQDLNGLLVVLDRLVRHGATVVVVEHNADFIRSADWIVDLGPGAGPRGGSLLYQGEYSGLLTCQASLTARALEAEATIQPGKGQGRAQSAAAGTISIRKARANNLKDVDVDIPKGKLTVVTGVSGSGKSSLVGDILQSEARRRFLESLSMYERQGLREGAQAPVESITGLGVTLSVAPQQAHLWSQVPQFTRRNSVGEISEIHSHLANLLSALGRRSCPKCGTEMQRESLFACPNCDTSLPIPAQRHFSSAHWSSTCKKCNGLGNLQTPEPDKLIIHPEKPLCAGAMYSPGYWPQSYLCKDQPVIAEIGRRYGFDPQHTPWNEMSAEARQVFLFGDGQEYTWTYISKGGRRKGQEHQSSWIWRGFYGEDSWIFEWDIHGTYTRQEVCPACAGAGLRSEYLAVTLQGRNIFEMGEMPLSGLEALVGDIPPLSPEMVQTKASLRIIQRRLRFLHQVGVGYLHLNRPTGSLSAGEAQRIQLASLLGSELTALTILMDEPSRGLHPSELEALIQALVELRDAGNTVILVEHDLQVIRAADHLVDMGPGAGAAGGQVVAQGTQADLVRSGTLTGKWLQTTTGESRSNAKMPRARRQPQDWMVLRGARANNLRGIDAAFPLGVICGVCGVSGSGKSTLVLDTLGRALVIKTHSTSFANEPIQPGEHLGIENSPGRAMLVDQTRVGIHSPATFLQLEKPLLKIFASSDDAHSLGLGQIELAGRCSACGGLGLIRIDMDFLPDEWVTCETCQGTGCRLEAWEVRYNGVSLPEINAMTLAEVKDLMDEEDSLRRPLEVVEQVGLGYLVWRQPAFTLSGGEAQRLKIAKELVKAAREPTLYILDEPTVGLHLEDVARLTGVLERLVHAGHTALVVEHNIHLLAACDWLVELGPGGGPAGGAIIAQGAPEQVARMNTPTAPYLRALLEGC